MSLWRSTWRVFWWSFLVVFGLMVVVYALQGRVGLIMLGGYLPGLIVAVPLALLWVVGVLLYRTGRGLYRRML